MQDKNLAYFASPYSNPDESVSIWYYMMAKHKVIELLRQGHNVISPIVYAHELYRTNPELGSSHDHWRGLNEALMERCDVMFIYKLPGWERSVGISAERRFMRNQMQLFLDYTPREDLPCPQSIIHL